MATWPLPAATSLVEVVLPSGRTYDVRVDGVAGDRLVVTAPPDLVMGDIPREGAELVLAWCDVRGRHRAAGVLAATSSGIVRTWTIEITERPRIEQRRAHVRGGGGEPAALWLDGPAAGSTEGTEGGQPEHEPEVLRGRVVDMSEAGMRIRFPAAPVSNGDAVTVHLWLPDDDFVISGTVQRMAREPDGPGIDVVVRYELRDAIATKIRKYVLDCQRRVFATTPRGR